MKPQFFCAENAAELEWLLRDARGAGDVLASLTAEQIGFMNAEDAGVPLQTLLFGLSYQVAAMAWDAGIALVKD